MQGNTQTIGQPFLKDLNDLMKVSSRDGKSIFECDQETCRSLCDAVSHFLPSFRLAKIFENLNIVLEYEDKTGNLFQKGQEKDTSSESIENSGTSSFNLSDTIRLHPVRSNVAESLAKTFQTEVEYDFQKCFVQSVMIQKYENTFPFNFYLENTLHQTFSSSDTAPCRSLSTETPSMEMEEHGDTTHANNLSSAVENSPQSIGFQNNIVYKFEHFFGQTKGDDDVNFPHCIYSSIVTEGGGGGGFVPIFGGTALEQIENGTISTGITIGNQPCTFFHAKHALYDVLRSMCERSQTYLIGISRVEDEPTMTTEDFSETTSIKKKKYKAFVITEKINRWLKEIPLEGFFCPSFIVSDALIDYKQHVFPLISKPCRLSDLLNLDVIFYKNGVSFKDYIVQDQMDDTIEHFEEFYMNQYRHLRVHLKFSVLVFPKNHNYNKQVMCCDI